MPKDVSDWRNAEEKDADGDTKNGLAIKLVWAYAIVVCGAGLIGLLYLRVTT
jgi:hypothetical protein